MTAAATRWPKAHAATKSGVSEVANVAKTPARNASPAPVASRASTRSRGSFAPGPSLASSARVSRASSTGSFTDSSSNPVTVYDDLGNALPFYSGTVASFQTSDTLWLKVTGAGDSALLTTGGALTVSGSAPRSTAAVRYRWTQDDGPALTIDTPDAATTTVRLAAAVAGGTGRATLRLTATDANGLSSTTTVPVRLFDLNSVTDRNWVLYYRSEAGDYIGGGQTQVLTDADGNFQSTVIGGNLSASMISPNFSSFWWYFSLATADGSPLTVGNYTGAQRAPFRSGGAPGLEFSGSGRGCNTISGNFQVLDIAVDGSGQLQRLAVDFEQHCEGGTPALFGSVRFHSSLPVRP